MRFALACWLFTRAVVFAAFAAAAPHGILAALGNWDGAWYGSIAVHGYEFARDGAAYNVAFFPLFPLLGSLLGHLGIEWPLAGALINNCAFLASVLLLYEFTRKRFCIQTARWVCATACALPLSLFCSVAYAEGLFFFFSIASLWCFENQRYALAGTAAACASATRPLGIALAVALIVIAAARGCGWRALLGSVAGLSGILAFAVFCAIRFKDPIAFVEAQRFWRHGIGFAPAGWLGLLRGAMSGRAHDWIVIAMLAAGVVAVAMFSRRLGAASTLYVALAYAMIIFSGTPLSIDRNLYSVAPLLVAIAALFQRVPYAGYATLAASLVLLALDTLTFARFGWVA
ncbi:MAG: mannosyltransferase family protein [Candidatus Baltobacteraceae bacterium]